MKVAFFIGSLNRGGTEMLVLDTFRKKDCASFEPILIYRNDGELSDAFRSTGVPMFRIKPHGLKMGYIQSIRRLLKRENVDILHTQTLINAVVGAFCAVFSKVKLVSSFHGFSDSVLRRIFASVVIWNADASIFVSEYVKNWYAKRILFFPTKKCFVIYNGCDFSKFNTQYPSPDFLKNERTLRGETMRFAMVGNFNRVRSQLFLCEVFKTLKDKGVNDFVVYFIGKQADSEPHFYTDCVRYCKDHVLVNDSIYFVGTRGDIPAILQNIDAFVYSSECDTFGIAVLEAMASGVPVIVNDWVVMKEVTCDGKYAMLYKSHDIEDCVKQIEDLINNISERKAVAKKNAETIRHRFSIENHIQNLYRVYEKALS